MEFMVHYIDANYPGVCYVVPAKLVDKFVDYMTGEGAALRRGCHGNDEFKYVRDVRMDSEYWGLVFD